MTSTNEEMPVSRSTRARDPNAAGRLLDEIHGRAIKLAGSHDVPLQDGESLVRMPGDPGVKKQIDPVVARDFPPSNGASVWGATPSVMAIKISLYP